jgi:exopolyphosphatase/guanosine-5'-triphosphate,3'-diphosphate pyrophosphatase
METRTVAFIDIGTSSIRLLVARIEPNGSYTIRSRQKETVRLGDGEFDEAGSIQPEPMEKAIRVARRFRDMAAAFGATDFIAVATAATREAKNRARFLERLREEALLDVHPVSGREEARLIYLGVSQGINLDGKPGIFIDIGGGSTEIVIGDGGDPVFLDSLKLGGIRLMNMFMEGKREAPVGRKMYREMKAYAGNLMLRTVQSAKAHPAELAVGSSGTIENLGEMAVRNLSRDMPGRPGTLTLAQLRALIDLLSPLALDERMKVPGINPDRADIIIPGAIILESFMERLKLEEIRISPRGLQDGLFADYLSRLSHLKDLQKMGTRERSVLRLARSCGVDEAHVRAITALALQLFDESRKAGLHDLGDGERDLLEKSAVLHDIGKFISYANHHEHSYYLVRNADLLGFDDREIAIMAHVVRHHRKKVPGRQMNDCLDLDGRSWKVIRVLSLLLRLAEGLDRSHAGLVGGVRLTEDGDHAIILEFEAEAGCELELWALERHRKAFTSLFNRELVVRAHCPGEAAAAPALKEG